MGNNYHILDRAPGGIYEAPVSTSGSAAQNADNLLDLIARIDSAGGGKIRLPQGTISYDTTLEFANANVELIGLGPGLSTLSYTGAGNGISVTAQQLVRLADFKLSTSTGAKGLLYSYSGGSTSFRHSAKRLYITGFSGNAVEGDGMELAVFEEIVAYQNGASGFHFEDSSNTGISNLFLRCRAEDNAGAAGWNILHMASSSFVSCQSFSNGTGQATDIQFRLQGSSRACNIIALDVENVGNSAAGIGLQAAGTEHKIDPGAVVSLATGIKLTSASECIVGTGTFSAISGNAYHLDSGSSNNYVMSGGASVLEEGSNTILSGDYLQLKEISDPAAPASNYGRLYFKDNGSGKTQLVARFPTGAVQVVATEP